MWGCYITGVLRPWGLTMGDVLVQEIMQRTHAVSRRHDVVASPFRVLVLSIVLQRKEARWADIKRCVEAILGDVNPNTLAFHLKRLVDVGWVRRSGSPEAPVYTVGDIPDSIRSEIMEEVVSKINEFLRRGALER